MNSAQFLSATVGLLCVFSSAGYAQQPAAAPLPPGTPDYSSRILTPPAPSTPRINGPDVYGERPGRPFIYSIPATGDRPMTFSAHGLPPGLYIDPPTGRVTGSVGKAGTYPVTLVARNAKGKSVKLFTVKIGDQIALTPPMGWNSWNSWAWTVDQGKVLRSARALVKSGLTQHGWTYINIDDTWQGKPDPQTHAQQGSEKFPDMKGLVTTLHGMGLKAGIYSTPWIGSYSMAPGGSADTPDRAWNPPPQDKRFVEPYISHFHSFGKISYTAADTRQWAQWGFDYLKYDWNPNDVSHVQEMHDALETSGRDMVFSLSNAAPFEHAADWARLSNAWRTTGDIAPNYESFCQNGFTQSKWAPFSGPGHWNDADMMILGYVGWGNPKPTGLNADEQYSHVSLWCLLSVPLLLGADLERLDPFTISLLSNDEVLAVDQDALGKAAVQVAASADTVKLTGPRPYAAHGETDSVTLPRRQVWAKPMVGGAEAVGLFNLGDADAPVTVNFTDLKLTGRQQVRDLWRQKNLGTFTGSYTATVPAHGTVLVKIGTPRR